ncbi:MAG TPA: hypothetical protein VIJ71_07245, partial [Mycobacteriales bacterium]
DQGLLDALYAHCTIYLHGHSVGGTNPSLLRAMGAGAPVAAYDVCFNQETLGGTGFFWGTAADLSVLLDRLTAAQRAKAGAAARERAAGAYSWDDVATSYLALAQHLANGPNAAPRQRVSLGTCLRAARSPEPEASLPGAQPES